MSLNRSAAVDAHLMGSRLAGARLLACATYSGPASTPATDLSAQLKEITDVPHEALKPLIIDPSRAARADSIAREWLADLLQAGPQDGIGVGVFWFADSRTHSLLDGAEPESRLVMVLIKLSRREDGTDQVSRIVWGPLAEAAR